MYESERFFTMTGDRVNVKPQSVNERQEALDAVHREYVAEPSMGGEGTSEETTHAVDTETPGLPEESVAEVEFFRRRTVGESTERVERREVRPTVERGDEWLPESIGSGHGAVLTARVLDGRERDAGRAAVPPVGTASGEVERGSLLERRHLRRANGQACHRQPSEFYEPAERGGGREQEASDGFAEAFTTASSGPSAETKGRKTTDSTETTQPEAGGSTATTKVETNDSAESTDAGVGWPSDGRERAYLKERNTVLSTKLEQREATIDELREQAETLEAELAALRSPPESDEWVRD